VNKESIDIDLESDSNNKQTLESPSKIGDDTKINKNPKNSVAAPAMGAMVGATKLKL
jgi:hypothetical protein